MHHLHQPSSSSSPTFNRPLLLRGMFPRHLPQGLLLLWCLLLKSRLMKNSWQMMMPSVGCSMIFNVSTKSTSEGEGEGGSCDTRARCEMSPLTSLRVLYKALTRGTIISSPNRWICYERERVKACLLLGITALHQS